MRRHFILEFKAKKSHESQQGWALLFYIGFKYSPYVEMAERPQVKSLCLSF